VGKYDAIPPDTSLEALTKSIFRWCSYSPAQGLLDHVVLHLWHEGAAQEGDQFPQRGWVQVTGSMAMHSQRAQNTAEGSRRERRHRQWKNWQRSFEWGGRDS
jgi:hypothetical protein